MHLKTLLWAHHENDVISYRIFTGSANFSEAAKTNQEHFVIYPDDEQQYSWYKDIAYTILDGTLSPETLVNINRPIVNLLTKNIVSSDRCHLMKSLSILIKQIGRGDKIYMSSFSYDDLFDTNKALLKAKEQGANIELIISKNSYNIFGKKVTSQLNELFKKKILVYTFQKTIDASGYNNETKNHSKYILIKKSQDYIVIEGSANLTYHSNFDINQLTIERNNKEKYDIFKQYHKELTRSGDCSEYNFTSTKSISAFVKTGSRFAPIEQPNKKRKLN